MGEIARSKSRIASDLLGGRFGYFYFFCSGEGKGVRGPRKGVGGVGYLLKMPGGRSPRREEEGGPKGREGVCGELGGGGGAKYFFSGPKCPPSLKTRDSNRWRPCDLKLRFETRDWRFVLNIPIQQNCEKGCDWSLSLRSKIASLAIGDFAHRKWPRSLFRPIPPRSWKEPSGPGWDEDGPGWPSPRDLDGSETL